MEQDKNELQSQLHSFTQNYIKNLQELYRSDSERKLNQRIDELNIANRTIADLQKTNQTLTHRAEELSAEHKNAVNLLVKEIESHKNQLSAKSKLVDSYKISVHDLQKRLYEAVNENNELKTQIKAQALRVTEANEEKSRNIENVQSNSENTNKLLKVAQEERLKQVNDKPSAASISKIITPNKTSNENSLCEKAASCIEKLKGNNLRIELADVPGKNVEPDIEKRNIKYDESVGGNSPIDNVKRGFRGWTQSACENQICVTYIPNSKALNSTAPKQSIANDGKVLELQEKLNASNNELLELNNEHAKYCTEKSSTESIMNDQLKLIQRNLKLFASTNRKLKYSCKYKINQIKSPKADLKDFKNRISVLVKRNKINNRTIAKQEQTIAQLREQLLSTQKQLSETRKQYFTRYFNLNQENDVLQDAKVKLQAERDALYSERENLNAAITNLEGLKCQLEQSERSENKGRLRAERRIDELVQMEKEEKEKMAQLQNELKNLREQLVDKSKQFETLSNKLQTEHKSISDMDSLSIGNTQHAINKTRNRISINNNDSKYVYQESNQSVLKITKNVNTNDEITLECSAILTNIIESIEIAANEANFMKQDPDIDYVGTIVSELAMKEDAAGKAVEKTCKGKPNTETDSSKSNIIVIADCLKEGASDGQKDGLQRKTSNFNEGDQDTTTMVAIPNERTPAFFSSHRPMAQKLNNPIYENSLTRQKYQPFHHRMRTQQRQQPLKSPLPLFKAIGAQRKIEKNVQTKILNQQQIVKDKLKHVVIFDRVTNKYIVGKNAPTVDKLQQWLDEHPTHEVVKHNTEHAPLFRAKRSQLKAMAKDLSVKELFAVNQPVAKIQTTLRSDATDGTMVYANRSNNEQTQPSTLNESSDLIKIIQHKPVISTAGEGVHYSPPSSSDVNDGLQLQTSNDNEGHQETTRMAISIPSMTGNRNNPVIWSGNVSMVTVATFKVSLSVISGSVAGINFGDELECVGRIMPETVWEYIDKARTSKDIVLVLFVQHAEDESNVSACKTFSTYLNTRRRLSVVRSPSPKVFRDFYILSLTANQSLPTVLKTATGIDLEANHSDLLIGIIVRNKHLPSVAPFSASKLIETAKSFIQHKPAISTAVEGVHHSPPTSSDVGLEFEKNGNTNNRIAIKYTTISSNTIESIANEMNLPKLDSEVDYDEKIVSNKIGKRKSTAQPDSSKLKLMIPLKRFYDIDAALEKIKKVEEICGKAFCKLGCICESIDDPKCPQAHCRKTICIFGCICTSVIENCRRSKRASRQPKRYTNKKYEQ